MVNYLCRNFESYAPLRPLHKLAGDISGTGMKTSPQGVMPGANFFVQISGVLDKAFRVCVTLCPLLANAKLE